MQLLKLALYQMFPRLQVQREYLVLQKQAVFPTKADASDYKRICYEASSDTEQYPAEDNAGQAKSICSSCS